MFFGLEKILRTFALIILQVQSQQSYVILLNIIIEIRKIVAYPKFRYYRYLKKLNKALNG